MRRRKWSKCNCTVCSCVAFLRHASSCFLRLLDCYMLTQHYCWGMLALLTMAWLSSSVFQNVLFQTSTLIGWVVAMCALLCFCPSLNKGVGLQINILTKVLVALGALVLLGSIVDLLCFQKSSWKTLLICIAITMFRLIQNIVQNIVGQSFCQNIV